MWLSFEWFEMEASNGHNWWLVMVLGLSPGKNGYAEMARQWWTSTASAMCIRVCRW